MTIDPELKQWATEVDAGYVDAINAEGSMRKAAKKLGCAYNAVQAAMARLSKRAAKQGYSPEHGMTKAVPSPFMVKGTSTLYDEDGKAKLQWVKTTLDGSKVEEMLREMVVAMTEDVKGKAPSVPAPKHTEADLLAVYPLGDPHFGMYAWAAEAGDDFDTDIAERVTCSAIDRLIDSAPAAETAIILPLGDLIHADSSTNRTPNSGASLDVDTRWARVMQIGLRALIYSIKQALRKHKNVVVRVVKGNHDPHASLAIALALDAYFHAEPRIEVDLSPAAHWYFRFGKVLIGSTHGDTTKEKDLLGVMASDRPKEWGDTQHRYWYCGHIHHVVQREYPGVIVEYFRTLAPKDAWHAGQGYRSGRDMCLIVMHKQYGEIERHRCDIGMLQ
jgi:hypothetical protein